MLLVFGVAHTALGTAQYVNGDAWGFVSILLGFLGLCMFERMLE
jgi:hypothetical protein